MCRRVRYSVMALVCLMVGGLVSCSRADKTPIRIGVLHALTGTMATSEKPLVDAVSMAVDELNAGGGVLGRPVEMVIADSQSDPARAAREAERLISQEQVAVLFACWTSSCRKAVKPVVEQHHHLLFYPVQYEGLEQSPNIIYTGATANQQISPGTSWAIKNLGKRAFLVGSDYVFPRLANRMIRDITAVNGGMVVGELYRPLGSQDFDAVAEAIRVAHANVILSTVNGDSNTAFFSAMQKAGLNSVPVMSFSVDDSGLVPLRAFGHVEHYATWGYLQNLPSDINQRFVAAWHARQKATDIPTSDPIEAAYIGVKLWAQAVEVAGSIEPMRVGHAVENQSIAAPSGILALDAATRHLWKSARIGKAQPDGGFDLVQELGGGPIRPQPFPSYRTREEWVAILRAGEQPVVTGDP